MLKTIKKKKEVRIDELIKYITMNAHTLLADKEFYTFKSNYGTDVTIDAKGNVNFSFMNYTPEDLFTIEIEEPITEDTEFETVVSVIEHNYGFNSISYNTNPKTSIKNFLESYENKDYKVLTVYALIDGKLELIWERDNQ